MLQRNEAQEKRDFLKKMLNNKVKAVQNNSENKSKYNRTQQNNIKNTYKKFQRPKVLFEIPKHKRILEQDVSDIETETLELKTICGIDNAFYKVVEGRPIRQCVDIKVYIKNLRDTTLFRTYTAYIKDQIIKIDTNFADELREYEILYKVFNETKTNYFHFIGESYDIANKTQQRADAKSEDLANIINQLNSLSFIHVKLNNKIGSLAASFGSLFRYASFLNQISPIFLTAQHGTKNSVDFIKVLEKAESNPTQSFEIFKAYFINASVRPKISFKKPQSLIRVFDEMCRQCLNYMEIQNYSASILKPVIKSRDQLEIKIIAEMNEVADLIMFYDQQVKWMEETEAQLKYKFNKLLLNEFYDLYASYDSTKLFTCVQFVHSRLFQGPEDPRDNITTMMGNIEKLFVNLTSGLDYLNQEVVKDVQYEVFSSDMKMIRRATKAQRILKECDILKKSLITSFEAPRYIHK